MAGGSGDESRGGNIEGEEGEGSTHLQLRPSHYQGSEGCWIPAADPPRLFAAGNRIDKSFTVQAYTDNAMHVHTIITC